MTPTKPTSPSMSIKLPIFHRRNSWKSDFIFRYLASNAMAAKKKNVTPILHEATLMQPVDLDDSRFQLHGVVDSKRSSTGSPNSCRSMGWVQNLSNFLRYLSAPGAQTQEAQNQQANISSFFVDGMAVWVASVRVTEY